MRMPIWMLEDNGAVQSYALCTKKETNWKALTIGGLTLMYIQRSFQLFL